MIIPAHGNLLKADAEVLVNTVNCVGVMGKGIALQFKQAYPANFDEYRKACANGQMRPGRMLVVATDNVANPKYIINFPTKRHWQGKSRIEDIQSGLDALIIEIEQRHITSIAVPPLGCGNGGLDWNDVEPMIHVAFARVPDVRALLYPPEGAPFASTMPVATPQPQLSPARAMLLQLLNLYGCRCPAIVYLYLKFKN